MLDRSSLIGFIACFALIIWAIVSEGDIGTFISFSSILIVVGGVIAATIINYNFQNIKNSFTTTLDLMKLSNIDLRTDMELLAMFARRVRRNGILVLDEDIKHLKDEYLKSGLQLAVDGFKGESLDNILKDEIESSVKQVELSIMVLN